MYTKKQRKEASAIITRIAKEHQVPESEVRAEIEKAIRLGMASTDPAVQAHWATLPFSGKQPTAEEIILWGASMV